MKQKPFTVPAHARKSSRPQKTNPRGCTPNIDLPCLERASERSSFRSLITRALDGEIHPDAALDEIAARLGSFAPVPVRGDWVPTISEAYHEAIALINRERHTGAPVQLDFNLPMQPRTLRTVVLALSNIAQQLQEFINEQDQQKNSDSELQGVGDALGVRLAHSPALGAEIQDARRAVQRAEQTFSRVPRVDGAAGEGQRIRVAA
jgi:hypothetical protein